MNEKGYKRLKKAVETEGETDVHSDMPGEGEDLPFIDIKTDSPANVFNDLHVKNLLASPDNKADGKKLPRLEWISTVSLDGEDVIMTFFDKNSAMKTSTAFLPR